MITSKVKVDPGAKRPKYFGFITGHENRPNVALQVLGPEYLATFRLAEYMIQTYKATKYAMSKVARHVVGKPAR